MFNLKEFLRPSTTAPALNALFAPHCFVDDNVFITKTNALCALLEIRGIDDECASDDDLEAQGKRIQNALKQFDENYTLYQYVIKDDAEPLAALETAGQSESVVETVERRREFLEAKGLHSDFAGSCNDPGEAGANRARRDVAYHRNKVAE
jgi:type IV secretory pathway VirB4 component